ncbi:hypothetical protein [Rickettsia australis]|uniref:Uncharacterized protein n=1 Tax=Rickettsia australis (strain Cutlack) TaxID=1105110 RepID=H8K9W1_RICAC|nr:hypothetical protein [Rickettsia australis]AFC70831.1 hypothetical protein MC5_02245 [Rickettsia australis str. Cutlack]
MVSFNGRYHPRLQKALKARNSVLLFQLKFIHTNLAELSTRQVMEANNATGMEENKVVSKMYS